MLAGETLLSGAARSCESCGKYEMAVLLSGGGYYVGTQCNCGPNSRESEYFGTREEAKAVLPEFEAALAGTGPRPKTARTAEWTGRDAERTPME